jgi:hypothetical protein
MALIKRGTPEERQAKALQKAKQGADATRDRLRSDFFQSPAGLARAAYEREDRVFQYSLDVHSTQAVVVPMVGAYTAPKATSDPSEILNSVCREGWDLVNGSFVFLELGSESRDKFLASGQQVAVKGTIVGYYLFRRAEENKVESIDPWEAISDPEPE